MLQSNQPYQSADQGISWSGIFGMAAVAGAGFLGYRNRHAIKGLFSRTAQRAQAIGESVASRASQVAASDKDWDALREAHRKWKASQAGGDAGATVIRNELGTVTIGGGASDGVKQSSTGRVLR
jgi:hypothetical protein